MDFFNYFLYYINTYFLKREELVEMKKTNRHRGIVLSNPKERYIELDHSYWLNYIPGKVIPKYDRKITFSDGDIHERKQEVGKHRNNTSKKNPDKSKNISKHRFGEVLSLYGTKEKLIYICKRGRFIYTCHMDSDDMFTGMKRITKENIVGKHDELDDEQKKKLLLRLERALELDKYIPQKAKEQVSVLVLKEKRKNK